MMRLVIWDAIAPIMTSLWWGNKPLHEPVFDPEPSHHMASLGHRELPQATPVNQDGGDISNLMQ